MILLLGVLVFIFYQWEKPPATFLPESMIQEGAEKDVAAYRNLEDAIEASFATEQTALNEYVEAMRSGDAYREEASKAQVKAAGQATRDSRADLREHIAKVSGEESMRDSDYVFIHFVLNELPIGLIGLLVAVILSAAMSSTASELSALATISTVDYYRNHFVKSASDHHYMKVSRIFTAIWGGLAILFALFASMVESLIGSGKYRRLAILRNGSGSFLGRIFHQAHRSSCSVCRRSDRSDFSIGSVFHKYR